MTPVAQAVLRRDLMDRIAREGDRTDTLAVVTGILAAMQISLTANGMGVRITDQQSKEISLRMCETVDVEMRAIEVGADEAEMRDRLTACFNGLNWTAEEQSRELVETGIFVRLREQGREDPQSTVSKFDTATLMASVDRMISHQ